MSRSTETSTALNVLTIESVVVVQTSDLQNIQVAYQLNGKNYVKWSQLVQTFSKDQGKLSHLLDAFPSKEDPSFAA